MQTWVIGNWKQNPATNHEAMMLAEALVSATKTDIDQQTCQLMVAPSCIHLATVSARLQGSSLLCAAQDISSHSAHVGAFTGDCSAEQIADAGASWTILGHSERRQYHKECNDTLSQKMSNALTQNLGIVLCVGETQAQYDANQTLNVLTEQLSVIKSVLQQADKEDDCSQALSKRLIIAYEPVWAIGTGKVPTVNEVNATHDYIKQTVARFADPLTNISVLYGGSVNAENASDFAVSTMIDGALVGGAALKPDSFLAIAKAFIRAKNISH